MLDILVMLVCLSKVKVMAHRRIAKEPLHRLETTLENSAYEWRKTVRDAMRGRTTGSIDPSGTLLAMDLQLLVLKFQVEALTHTETLVVLRLLEVFDFRVPSK